MVGFQVIKAKTLAIFFQCENAFTNLWFACSHYEQKSLKLNSKPRKILTEELTANHSEFLSFLSSASYFPCFFNHSTIEITLPPSS